MGLLLIYSFSEYSKLRFKPKLLYDPFPNFCEVEKT